MHYSRRQLMNLNTINLVILVVRKYRKLISAVNAMPCVTHVIVGHTSTHPGTICKSQLLTLFTHVCTHSHARFYRRCKRHQWRVQDVGSFFFFFGGGKHISKIPISPEYPNGDNANTQMGTMCGRSPHRERLAAKPITAWVHGPVLGPLVGSSGNAPGGAQGAEPPEAPGFKSPKNPLQGVYFTYNFWISVLSILVV